MIRIDFGKFIRQVSYIQILFKVSDCNRFFRCLNEDLSGSFIQRDLSDAAVVPYSCCVQSSFKLGTGMIENCACDMPAVFILEIAPVACADNYDFLI